MLWRAGGFAGHAASAAAQVISNRPAAKAGVAEGCAGWGEVSRRGMRFMRFPPVAATVGSKARRSEEYTSELQSLRQLVCRLLLEKKIQRASAGQPDSVERGTDPQLSR